MTVDTTGFLVWAPAVITLSLYPLPQDSTTFPLATLSNLGWAEPIREFRVDIDTNGLVPGSYGISSGLTDATGDCTTAGPGGAQYNLEVTAAAPSVTIQSPAQQFIVIGTDAQLTARVVGSGPLTQQWERSIDNGVNFTPIADAEALQLDLQAISTAEAGLYRLRASNPEAPPDGVVSAAVRLTVVVSPTITTAPVNALGFEGGLATFSVVALGTPVLEYQWRRGGAVIDPADNASAATGTLELAHLTSADNGATFTVTVRNSYGEITSAEVSLEVQPLAAAQRGVTGIVSVDPAGRPGDRDSAPIGASQIAASADGRHVAFWSSSALASGHPAACGLFLRDLLAQRSELLTLRADGSPAPFSCGGLIGDVVAMTPDARYVVYVSHRGDLASPETTARGAHVYVRDTCTGAPAPCTPSTQRVSVDAQGGPVHGIDAVRLPSISDDGRHVAFIGRLGSDTGPLQALVRDRQAERTAVVSLDHAGQPRGALFGVHLSGNGRYAAFDSPTNAQDCKEAQAVNGVCVFVHDRDADGNGVFDETTRQDGVRTVNVSVNSAGYVALGGMVYLPWISRDGRIVVYLSNATNLGAATATGNRDELFLFAHDRDVNGSGTFDRPGNVATLLASVDAAGNEVRPDVNAGSGRHSWSGRFIAFGAVGNLAPPNSAEPRYVPVLRDLCIGAQVPAGCTPQTVRLNQRADGTAPTAGGVAPEVVLTSDGRVALFAAAGADLVDLDGDGAFDAVERYQVYRASTGVEEEGP